MLVLNVFIPFYQKNILDVKFCEGGPLEGELYVFRNGNEFWYMGLLCAAFHWLLG